MLADFVSHLEELRKRLFICLFVFAAASIASYFFARPILDFLTQPLKAFPGTALVFTKPYEAFLTYVKASVFSGTLVSSPVIFAQSWLFAAPGLYAHEKKTIFPLIFISALLFFAGVVFCYYFVIPASLHFLLAFESELLRPMITVGAYFSFITGMMFGFGLLFDFPVLVVGLVDLGIVQTKTLAGARRIMIVGIFIAAAVLTPSPDPVSQLLLAAPLMLLFEISLWVASLKEKRRVLKNKRGRDGAF